MTKTALEYPRSECRRLWRRLYTYLRSEKDHERRASLVRDMRWLRAGCTARAERPVSKEPSQQLGAVNGSPSLRWIAEPTRAGWWWWSDGIERPRPLCVIDGAWITSETEMHWLEVSLTTERLTMGQWESRCPGGRWAGPIEPPKVPDEDPTANDTLDDSSK